MMQDKKENKSTKEKKDIINELPKVGIVWVAALVAVAFVLGFAVRGFVLPTSEQPLGTPQFEGPTAPGVAPPLSEEQIQQEQMPPGHPPIGEEATTPEAATESAPPNQSP